MGRGRHEIWSSVEEVERLYCEEQLTHEEIANEFGCVRQLATRVIRQEGIEREEHRCNHCGKVFDSAKGAKGHEARCDPENTPWHDVDVLKSLYEDGLSAEEIADEFGCGATTIRRHIRNSDEIEHRYTCESCGRGFDTQNGLNMHRNGSCDATDKPWQDEEKLRHMVVERELQFTEIADIWGGHAATIRKWADDFGIEKPSKPWEDEERIRRLRYEEGDSVLEIAEELGCSPGTITDILTAETPPEDYSYPCPYDGCDQTIDTERGRSIHVTRTHERETGEFPCAKDGCDRTFSTQRDMKVHHKTQHGESIAGLIVECSWCGDEFRRQKARVERGERNFCPDKDCEIEWRHSLHGQDHWMWEGGKRLRYRVVRNLTPSWGKATKKAREREDNTCRLCGKTADEIGRNMDVHHFIPVRAGGLNEQWCLGCFCNSCHKKAERFVKDRIEMHLRDYTDEELPDGRSRPDSSTDPDSAELQLNLSAFAE